MRGMLVVVEGGDGSGKGSQSSFLYHKLKRERPDLRPLLTHEPWEGERYGRHIRAILTHRSGEVEAGDGRIIPEKFQRLFVANRQIHHEKVIQPALREGRIVICDRERLSTMAYGMAFGVDPMLILGWHEELAIPTPDLVLYLRTSAATCIARLNRRDKTREYFEREDMIHRVLASYESLLEQGVMWNTYIVNNEQSKPEVSRVLWGIVQSFAEGM
jgi:dTMP kinase